MIGAGLIRSVASAAAAIKAEILALFAASGGSSLLGFLAAGVGAVARTLQDELRERVSVRQFGAVGDGVTNDTAAIQAAINACSYSRKRLYFPAGVYAVSTLRLHYDAVANPGFNPDDRAQGRLELFGDGQCDDGQAITGEWGKSGTTLVFSSANGLVATRAASPYPIRALRVSGMTLVGNAAGYVVDYAAVHTHSALEWVTIVQQHKDGHGLRWLDAWQYNLRGVYVINTANAGEFAPGVVITGTGATFKNPTIAGGQINLDQLTVQGFAVGYQFGEPDYLVAAQSITQISLVGVQALKCGAGFDMGKGVSNLDSLNIRTESCATRGVRVHAYARNVTLRGRHANRGATEADVVIGRNTGVDLADTVRHVRVRDSAFTQINAVGIACYPTANARGLGVEDCYLTAFSAGVGVGVKTTATLPSQWANAPVLRGAMRFESLATNREGAAVSADRARKMLRVSNGEFADTDANGTPDLWGIYFGAGSIGAGIDPYGSGKSYRGSNGAGADAPIYQVINFPANTLIRVGYWVKSIAAATTYHVRITDAAATAPVLGTLDSAAPGATATYREAYFFTGAATSARLELRGAEFSLLEVENLSGD